MFKSVSCNTYNLIILYRIFLVIHTIISMYMPVKTVEVFV